MRRRPLAFVVVGAGLLATLAGCGSAGDGRAGATLGAIGEDAPEPATAVELIRAAAKEAKVAAGVKIEFTVRLTSGKEGAARSSGEMRARTEPGPAFDESLHEYMVDGKEIPGGVRTLLIGKVAYVKMPVLAGATGGKPWIRMPLNGRDSDRLNLDDLLQQGQRMDPVAHTQMIASSKDVKAVGQESVGDVRTTHYRGTFEVAEGLADLDAEAAAAVEQSLAGVQKMRFDLWLDDRWLARKIYLTGRLTDPALGSGTLSMVMRYRDYGEPVRVRKPPSGQTIDRKNVPGLNAGA